MLAYKCKQCGIFAVLGGYKNKYNEYFCSINCYKKYCENNNYEFQTEHIKRINE